MTLFCFVGCTPLPGREVRPAPSYLLGADCTEGRFRKKYFKKCKKGDVFENLQGLEF
jgi:hypothetical protein